MNSITSSAKRIVTFRDSPDKQNFHLKKVNIFPFRKKQDQ